MLWLGEMFTEFDDRVILQGGTPGLCHQLMHECLKFLRSFAMNPFAQDQAIGRFMDAPARIFNFSQKSMQHETNNIIFPCRDICICSRDHLHHTDAVYSVVALNE